MTLFAVFERLIAATAPPPTAPPPSGLLRFYLYYLRQVGWLVVLLFAAGCAVALLDSLIPVFIGRVVTLVSGGDPVLALSGAGPELLGMAAVVLILRPLMLLAQNLITNQTLAPGLGNLIRWQSHWHLVRQGWSFFQNQAAGVLANRVVQTGPCLRETVVLSASAVWYILIYGGSAIALLAANDPLLSLPVIGWFGCYALLLLAFIPRIRVRSRDMSAVRSELTGTVVDCYTNIVTVKLFSRPDDEDRVIRDAIDAHTASYHAHLRLTSLLMVLLALLNAALIVGSAALALLLWRRGEITIGALAMTLPLTWQIATIAGWVAQHAAALFENIGAVEDGMKAIAAPSRSREPERGAELTVPAGEIVFDAVWFDYGADSILRGVTLTIAPGERVGLRGPSGAGKSTLAHLLLRLYDLKSGAIRIDGQDIAGVSLESLRRQVTLITQDGSLLNRSIRDNLRLGRPDATDAEIRAAAQQAMALGFIEEITDGQGRTGLDAHVGERGVTLSGGQRQRIVIARALLKNAPILILDEATSALDAETEAAVRTALDAAMTGRTLITISHHPSGIAGLDRLVTLDRGRLSG